MNEQTNRPLISIVVPVYNGSAYLAELMFCLEKQLSGDTELVFVDDGSIDDSLEKLLALQQAAACPVKVHTQKNRGVSAARNVGMGIANGRYLTFVDVDDRVSENYIAALSELARRNVDLAVFDSRRVREGVRDGTPMPGAVRERTKEEMLTEFLYDPTRFGVCNLLIRRELPAQMGIRFPEGYPYYEDYDFLLQIFARSERIVRLDQVLYDYVLREGSAMAKFSAARINCLKLMKNREEWLIEHAPEFAPMFCRWGVARLYWSVLWQAALALPSYREFREFARVTGAEGYLKKLGGYPDRLLRISTGVFLCCPPAYYLAVRAVGRRKSKIEPVKLQTLLRDLDAASG